VKNIAVKGIVKEPTSKGAERATTSTSGEHRDLLKRCVFCPHKDRCNIGGGIGITDV
jgi:hypothetical protein